jgi:hypothetical protein
VNLCEKQIVVAPPRASSIKSADVRGGVLTANVYPRFIHVLGVVVWLGTYAVVVYFFIVLRKRFIALIF